jgi:hypothetical protein
MSQSSNREPDATSFRSMRTCKHKAGIHRYNGIGYEGHAGEAMTTKVRY